MPLSRDQIRSLLYGQGKDPRFTQDSPVMPDVWMEYAENPDAAVDLLLTPHQERSSASLSPAVLASELDRLLRASAGTSNRDNHEIAVNQTTVAVRLRFDEMVRTVLPLSSWWQSRLLRARADSDVANKASLALAKMKTAAGRKWLAKIFSDSSEGHPDEMTQDVFWLMMVLGVISLSHKSTKSVSRRKGAEPVCWPIPVDCRRFKASTSPTAGSRPFTRER